MAFHKLTCGWDKAVGYCIALHWKLGTEGIDPNDKFEINLARHLYIACIHFVRSHLVYFRQTSSRAT